MCGKDGRGGKEGGKESKKLGMGKAGRRVFVPSQEFTSYIGWYVGRPLEYRNFVIVLHPIP